MVCSTFAWSVALAILPAIKRWAEREFAISADHAWRTIAPLARAALPASQPGLYLVGDAARVVEPFTGEGIYYALRSGELAAEAIESNESHRYSSGAPRSFMPAAFGSTLLARTRGPASAPHDQPVPFLA